MKTKTNTTNSDHGPSVFINLDNLVAFKVTANSRHEVRVLMGDSCLSPSPEVGGSRQWNKGRDEIRTLIRAPIGAEASGFPLVEQAARLTRITNGKKTDSVELLTSRPARQLSATDWLKLNRQSWGIESGLHQRLDVSHLDDLSFVRKPRSMLFMAMFRRLSNSLCMHWINKQPRPHHKTTTDFFSAMNAENHRYVFRSLLAAHPAFSQAS